MSDEEFRGWRANKNAFREFGTSPGDNPMLPIKPPAQPTVDTETSEPVEKLLINTQRIKVNSHAAGILKAVKSSYQSRIDRAEVDLSIILGNLIVGDHSDIVDIADSLIITISDAKGYIAEVERREEELEEYC